MGYQPNIKSLMLDPTMGRLKIFFKLLVGICFSEFLFVAKVAIILGKYRKNDDHQ
jgi:hypothetical protein